MTERSLDDFNHERQALDAAHTQNEAGRDAFVALAHTALFAASVAFVGDVAPIAEAIWKPALIAGWLTDVVGLLALTFSFTAARKAIDARRAALNELDPPIYNLCEWLNAIALWSFPVALLCLFSFVTANVVQANDRQNQPAASRDGRSDASEQRPLISDSRSLPAATSTGSREHPDSLDRGDSCTASTSGPAAAATCSEKVKATTAKP